MRLLTSALLLLIAVSSFACGQQDNGINLTKEGYGDKWPFTIPEGKLECLGYKEVVITYKDVSYALNGQAMGTKKYQDMKEIWRDHPDHPGIKMSVIDVIQMGLPLCKH